MSRVAAARSSRRIVPAAAVAGAFALASVAPATAAPTADAFTPSADASAAGAVAGITPCAGDPTADIRGLADRPHLAGSQKLPYISVHGWWVKCRANVPGAVAQVTVELQQYKRGWVTVAKGDLVVPPGGGAGKRATAQGRCHTYRGGSYRYRARIDVDVIGISDTDEKQTGPVGSSPCSVLGR